jgi:hypothetical protein
MYFIKLTKFILFGFYFSILASGNAMEGMDAAGSISEAPPAETEKVQEVPIYLFSSQNVGTLTCKTTVIEGEQVNYIAIDGTQINDIHSLCSAILATSCKPGEVFLSEQIRINQGSREIFDLKDITFVLPEQPLQILILPL